LVAVESVGSTSFPRWLFTAAASKPEEERHDQSGRLVRKFVDQDCLTLQEDRACEMGRIFTQSSEEVRSLPLASSPSVFVADLFDTRRGFPHLLLRPQPLRSSLLSRLRGKSSHRNPLPPSSRPWNQFSDSRRSSDFGLPNFNLKNHLGSIAHAVAYRETDPNVDVSCVFVPTELPQLTESQVERFERFGRALRLLKVEDGVPKMFSLTYKRVTYGGKRREGKRNWAPSLMLVNKVVLRGRLGGGSSSMGLVFRWRVLDLSFSFWAGTVFSGLLYDHYASLPSTPLPRFGNREGVRCRPSI